MEAIGVVGPTRPARVNRVDIPEVDQRPRRPHIACIDGLRAVAAGTILVYHAAFLAGTTQSKTIGPYLDRLDIGVPIFFVISGFLLYLPFVDSHVNDRRIPAVGLYLRRRVLRIFPAYWVALTATLVAGLTAAPIRNVWDWTAYYGLLQTYSPAHLFGGLPQAWTLCIEVSFYAFLPLYALLLRHLCRQSGRLSVLRFEIGGLVLLYGTSVAFRAWEWNALPFGGESFRWLPAQLDYFALGMALAVAHRYLANRAVPSTVARALGTAPWAWWGAAVGFWWLSVQLTIPVGKVGVGAVTSMEQQFLYGATAFFLMVPAVFCTNDRGVVSGLLANRPMAFLGTISYGVYLWHYTVLLGWYEITGTSVFGGGLPRVLAVCILVSGLLAALSWLVVEKPAQGLGRQRRQESRVPSS